MALPGIAAFFKKESEEERGHAELLMDYQARLPRLSSSAASARLRVLWLSRPCFALSPLADRPTPRSATLRCRTFAAAASSCSQS